MKTVCKRGSNANHGQYQDCGLRTRRRRPGQGEEDELLADLLAEGYLLLNHAGDGRHVFVSSDKAFGALDLGSFSKPHGDHLHHYAGGPVFPGFEVGATKPGHVAAGDGKAVLFDDETGDVTTMRLTGMNVVDHFRVPVHDGIFVGCADGGVVSRDGEVTKVTSPDEYGRIGNRAGSAESWHVLGEFKSDKKAADAEELERPEKVSIINAETAELKLVDLGTSYTFRSLGMNDDGLAVVLGTDGKRHLIDAAHAKVVTTVDVIDAWEESEERQDLRPALAVTGDVAYATDPATKKVHVVDLTGEKGDADRRPAGDP